MRPLEERGEIAWIAAKRRDPRVLLPAFKYQIDRPGQQRALPACHWMTSCDEHVCSMGEIPVLPGQRKVQRRAFLNRVRPAQLRGRPGLFASQPMEPTTGMTATATSIAT